jgi:hypothetical protein
MWHLRPNCPRADRLSRHGWQAVVAYLSSMWRVSFGTPSFAMPRNAASADRERHRGKLALHAGLCGLMQTLAEI